ncbi:MAG: 5-formyltetrahydrofolate cyclo-ligase [Candidatus Spyradenecus sp.]
MIEQSPEALRQAKRAIRAQMRQLRAAISKNDRFLAGKQAAEMLLDPRGLALVPRFRVFASYLSTEEEFPTEELHLALFQVGAMVAVPRFSQRLQDYHWAPLPPGAPLRQGPHGIWEPAEPLRVSRAEMEVVLVPGVAFDTRGGRIGYGAGIYDRLLAQLRPGVLRVGVAYNCQVLREPLPQEAHDRLMDYIVTEDHWIDCRRARNVCRPAYGTMPTPMVK